MTLPSVVVMATVVAVVAGEWFATHRAARQVEVPRISPGALGHHTSRSQRPSTALELSERAARRLTKRTQPRPADTFTGPDCLARKGRESELTTESAVPRL